MPSPVAHIAVGYAIYRLYGEHRLVPTNEDQIGSLPRLLIVTVGLSLLPDLDFIPGFFSGSFDQFHNNASHSLSFGLLVALIIGLVVWLKKRSGFLFWFVLSLLCYELHVLMDFFTVGRGVMLLWPFSLERYEPGVKLFYGLHRSDGWLSIRHLWTLLTELGFAILVNLVTDSIIYGTTKMRLLDFLRGNDGSGD